MSPAAAAGTVRLGDLTVNRMGFGAMRVCGPDIWGPPKDRAAAQRVLRRAIELGVNFLDTADSYGPEVDETLIAEAVHPYPAGLVIGSALPPGLPRSQASESRSPNTWQPAQDASPLLDERLAS